MAGDLLEELMAAEAALEAATQRTPEAEREAMEACREQAAEHGEQPKSESENGMAGCMRRKFERFLARHGDAYSYEAELGPTVELVRRFMEYCWSGAGREQLFSGVGRKSFADAYFELHLAYTLAQKVFGMMGLIGWTGLEKAERKAKAEPYKDAIKEHFKLLKTSRTDVEGMGRSLQKEKWDDQTYFLGQDYWMGRIETEPNKAVFSLAIMGFVRVTCSRGGSMGRDWFDRAGLTLLWVGRNILSVKDFTWATDHFMIEMPEVEEEAVASKEVEAAAGAEAEEAISAAVERAASAVSERVEAALRGEVHINRIKKHYYEKYRYDNSITPDTIEVVRRASTWQFEYQWLRGLFEVQYDGLSDEEVGALLRSREDGYDGYDGAMVRA